MAINVDGSILSYATVADFIATPEGAIWTDIANVTKFTPGEMTCKDVDVTTLLSTDQWDESDPGRKSAGASQVTALYDKESEDALADLLGVQMMWRIIFPDGTTATNGSRWIAKGYLNKQGKETQEGDKIRTPLAMKLTGKPFFTEA